MKKIVSVIITTLERKPELYALLSSLYFQTLDNLEIIVSYSNYEKDIGDINQIGAMLRARNNSLILLKKKKKDAVNGRNVCIKAATGKYLFFCDDDNFLRRDTLYNLKEVLDNEPEIEIVGPKVLTLDNSDNHYKDWSLTPYMYDEDKLHQTIKVEKGILYFSDKIQVTNCLNDNLLKTEFLVNSFMARARGRLFDLEYAKFGVMEEIDFTYQRKCAVRPDTVCYHNRALAGGFRLTKKKYLKGFNYFAMKWFGKKVKTIESTN
jgi:glycosyltransferase involved in cell wall biosynthesis